MNIIEYVTIRNIKERLIQNLHYYSIVKTNSYKCIVSV